MIGLKQPRHVRSELLKLLLEKLLFVICNGLFVQNQNLRNVVVVNLHGGLVNVNVGQRIINKPFLSNP